MNKIPVGDTISRTYAFTFSNLVSLAGIVWLPYLVVFAFFAALVYLLAPELPQMVMRGEFDPIAAGPVLRKLGLISIFLFIAYCMVTVGLQRKALGLHPGPVYAYFSLGAPVWRMAGAFFLALIVLFFIGLLTLVVAFSAWYVAGQLASPYAIFVRVLVCVAAVLWFIYLCIRLTFFLPAVVVAEEQIGLGRAWELGGGNFWRIFIVVIAVFVPVAIGFGILFSALLGPIVSIPHIWHPGMDMRSMIRDILRQSMVFSPFAIILRIVERVLFLGLGNAAIANSYRAVTARPDNISPSTTSAPA